MVANNTDREGQEVIIVVGAINRKKINLATQSFMKFRHDPSLFFFLLPPFAMSPIRGALLFRYGGAKGEKEREKKRKKSLNFASERLSINDQVGERKTSTSTHSIS